MPNIYQHISKNKRDTVIIMAVFVVIISFIGWFIGEYFYDGIGLPFVGIAMLISGFSGYFSYYNSDKIVLKISKATEVSYDQAPDLHNLVDNMSIASGILKPRIFLIDDTAMNAFATGRDPEHAVICFTTGIVEKLEKRELEGVVAHEMSHIGNYDIRLMSIVSILVGTLTLISDLFLRGVFRGGRKKSSKSSGQLQLIIFIIGILLIILSPIISTLIKLAISRRREYLADSTAALITRYPQGLANALRKLSLDTEILEAANGATAHLYISNPNRAGVLKFMSKLYDTHPPIADRIAKLESM